MRSRKHIKAQMDIAYKLIREGKNQEAIDYLNKLLVSMPNEFTALQALARCYTAVENFELAGKQIEKAKKLFKAVNSQVKPDEKKSLEREICLMEYYLLMRQGEVIEAYNLLEQYPDQDDVKINLAKVGYLLADRKFQEAEKILNTIKIEKILSKTQKNDVEAFRRKIDAEKQSINGKILSLKSIDKFNKLDQKISFLRSVIDSVSFDKKNKEIDELVAALENVFNRVELSLDSNPQFYSCRAHFYFQIGNKQKEIEVLNILEKRFPDYWKGHFMKALWLYKNGDHKDSIDKLKYLIKQVDNETLLLSAYEVSEVYTLCAQNYLELVNNKMALQYIELAVSKDPTNPAAFSTLGKYHRAVGDDKKADAAFQTARQLNAKRFAHLHPLPKNTKPLVSIENEKSLQSNTEQVHEVKKIIHKNPTTPVKQANVLVSSNMFSALSIEPEKEISEPAEKSDLSKKSTGNTSKQKKKKKPSHQQPPLPSIDNSYYGLMTGFLKSGYNLFAQTSNGLYSMVYGEQQPAVQQKHRK